MVEITVMLIFISPDFLIMIPSLIFRLIVIFIAYYKPALLHPVSNLKPCFERTPPQTFLNPSTEIY